MPEPPHNNICLPVKRLRNIKARVRGYTGCRDLILAQVKFVSFFTKLLKYKPELNRIEIGLRLPNILPVCTYLKLWNVGTAQAILYILSFFKPEI